MNKYQLKSSPHNINLACMNSIREVERDLGTKDAIELFSNALPLISQRKDLISQAIQQSDLANLKLHAHKALGSVRLYGTTRLEELLTHLKFSEAVEQDFADFHHELLMEFDSVSFTINEWLLSQRQAA